MMSVAQRMQHVLHRVIGLPVVMVPIEGQKSSRGDVQPLGLAAEAKTCFVQVFDLRAAYFLAHRIDEVFKSTGARTAHPGNGCRDQADGEEIAHQLGQAVLRQEMSVQEINDHRANPRAVVAAPAGPVNASTGYGPLPRSTPRRKATRIIKSFSVST